MAYGPREPEAVEIDDSEATTLAADLAAVACLDRGHHERGLGPSGVHRDWTSSLRAIRRQRSRESRSGISKERAALQASGHLGAATNGTLPLRLSSPSPPQTVPMQTRCNGAERNEIWPSISTTGSPPPLRRRQPIASGASLPPRRFSLQHPRTPCHPTPHGGVHTTRPGIDFPGAMPLRGGNRRCSRSHWGSSAADDPGLAWLGLLEGNRCRDFPRLSLDAQGGRGRRNSVREIGAFAPHGRLLAWLRGRERQTHGNGF